MVSSTNCEITVIKLQNQCNRFAWHFVPVDVVLCLHYLSLCLDYHPINTNLTTSLSDRSVVVNETFNIRCSSDANPPAKYRFYKNQDNFVNITNGSDVSVITTSVSERRKQVNYSCTPFNDFGDGRTDWLSLEVLCKYIPLPF